MVTRLFSKESGKVILIDHRFRCLHLRFWRSELRTQEWVAKVKLRK